MILTLPFVERVGHIHTSMTNTVLYHTRCPECAKLGKDNHGDNLATYSDGSFYCFSCGYSQSAQGLSKLKKRKPATERGINLPHDSTDVLPPIATQYLRKYSLTDQDKKLNTIMWSDHWQRLIFPYFNDTGLLAWQGRYLGTETDKAKWFSQGNLQEFIHLIGNKNAKTVVLTEDVISAIRVSHNTSVCASHIFGSHVSANRMLKLLRFFDVVYIWLDKDKAKESIQFSEKIRSFGGMSRCIITDKDPKEYSDTEITNYLG